MLNFARRPRFLRVHLGPVVRGARARPGRAFRPVESSEQRLEPRVVPSASAAGHLTALPGVAHSETLTYPTPAGSPQRLTYYLPQGPAPAGGWPVVIAIHGGGWRRLGKAGYGDRVASAFVPDGYVVVAPNYQLSRAHRPSWPVNLEDVRAVVGWVRSNADALGADPNRIAAMGESAGGNLAELLGTDPGGPSTSVNAVISFSGPSDLPVLYNTSRWAGRAAAQFLGGTPTQMPARYAAASPIDHVAPGDPPMLLVHGSHDTLVPTAQSELMAAALTQAGVPNRLILVPGGHNLDYPVHYADLTHTLLEFLSSTWNDEQNPSDSNSP